MATVTSFKVARRLILDQNGHEHEICTQDLTPPTHQNHCRFVLFTPLRSVHHQNMVFSVLEWVSLLTREALRCQRCVMSVALGCDFLRLAP